MVTGKLVLRQENNNKPKVGDICRSRQINLFMWTENHQTLNVLDTLPEYSLTRVMLPYVVANQRVVAGKLKPGDLILTPNHGVQKVGKTGKSNVILGENPMQFWYAEDVQLVLVTPEQFAKVLVTVYDDSDMPCRTEYRDISIQQVSRIMDNEFEIMLMSDEKGKPYLHENKVVLSY